MENSWYLALGIKLSKYLMLKLNMKFIISKMHMKVFAEFFYYLIRLDRIYSVTISHDSRLIVSGSADKSIKVFDIFTEKEIDRFAKLRAGISLSKKLSNQ